MIKLTIYIDVLIVVNIYICWMLLYLTRSIVHVHIKCGNLAMASILGGISSLLCLLDSDSKFMNTIFATIKLLSIALIITAAFSGFTIRQKLVYGSIYFLMNLILAGFAQLLSNLIGDIFVYNGTVYLDIPLLGLVLVTAAVYCAMTLMSYLLETKYNKETSYNVMFEYNGIYYDLPALADTGNSAKDIFSGKPVIVCKGIKLYSKNCDKVIIIPYTTVAGEGILYAIKPNKLIITDDKGRSKQVDCLCASAEGKEQIAIFNPCLLN